MSLQYTIERKEGGKWHRVTTGVFHNIRSNQMIRKLAKEHPESVGIRPSQRTYESYSDGTRLYVFTLRQLLDFNSKQRPEKRNGPRWATFAHEMGLAMRRMLPFGQDPDKVRLVTPNGLVEFASLTDLQKDLPQ